MFPSVFVWVQYKEPGNMHPSNSNAWITYPLFSSQMLPPPKYHKRFTICLLFWVTSHASVAWQQLVFNKTWPQWLGTCSFVHMKEHMTLRWELWLVIWDDMCGWWCVRRRQRRRITPPPTWQKNIWWMMVSEMEWKHTSTHAQDGGV